MRHYFHDIQGNVLIIDPDEAIDTSGAKELDTTLEGLLDGDRRRVVIDCGDVRHISSAGLGVLMMARRRLAKIGGDIRLARLSGPVASVLHVSMLDTVLTFYHTLDDALRSFHEDGAARDNAPLDESEDFRLHPGGE
jgi:anti-anti-sigma factor